MLRGIVAADIPAVWEQVKPFIERACEYSNGKYEADDFYHPLLERDMQLWVNGNSAAITEIRNYPHKKVLCFPICGGSDLAEIRKDIAIIEQWGKEQGCQISRIEGRPGWQRTLKNYEFVQVSMERVL